MRSGLGRFESTILSGNASVVYIILEAFKGTGRKLTGLEFTVYFDCIKYVLGFVARWGNLALKQVHSSHSYLMSVL
jgi:hypothetical protein